METSNFTDTIPAFNNFIDITKVHDDISENNFQEICRCCVVKKGEVNVFKAQFRNVLVADLIYFCTNERVLSCDGLPSLICNICKDQIVNSYEFINKVKDNQVHIRKLSQIFSSKHQEQSEEIDLSNNYVNLNVAPDDKEINRDSVSSIAHFKQKYKGLTKVYEQLCYILLQNKSQIKRCIKGNLKKNKTLVKGKNMREKVKEKEIISEHPMKCQEDITKELSVTSQNNELTLSDKHGEKLIDNVYKLENTVSVKELKLNGEDIETNNNDQISIQEEIEDSKKENGTQCLDCSEVLYTEAGIIRHCHLTGHVMAYRFKCELCSSTFRLRRCYKMHLRRHSESKRICEVCGVTMFANNLKRHMDVHNDIKVHVCKICAKIYATKAVLDVHIKNQHSGKDNTFLCSICGKSFRTLYSLNTHMNHQHINDDLEKKSYQCELCPRFFVSKDSLKFHQKFSHAEIPIMRHEHHKRNKMIPTDQTRIVKQKHCYICLKFVKLSEYKMHMLMHRRSKPLQCKVCNKYFRQNWRLKSHMKNHRIAELLKI